MKIISKTISGIVALFMLGSFPISGHAASSLSAPSINTLSATTVTSTTATLNGFFNANGVNTSTWFKYGTSASNLNQNSNPISQGNGSGQFSYTITGLTPNTTYYFKAGGSNFYGTTFGTSTLTFTTGTAQTASLTLTTITQTNVTTNSATLNGHYSATLNAPIVWFKYGTSASSLNQLTNPQAVTVGSNSFSANLTGLNPNTTYYFKAFGSQNGNVTSAPTTLQFTTQSAPVATMTVNTMTQSNVTTNSADLNGYITMTNTTATSRYFKWGTSATNLSSTLSVSGGQNAPGLFSGALSNLNSNTTYYFKAYAVSAGGTTVSGTTLQFRTNQAPVTYACNDGIDNDGDGLTDYPADPGCTSPTDNNEYNTQQYVYACNDNIDNDGDGLIDLQDPGCMTFFDNDESNIIIPPTTYACNDGIDNDYDGLIDYPADPGCTSPNDNNEYDPLQPVYACNDNIDNDGDGLIDLQDPGCTSSTDNSEYNSVNTGSAPSVTTGGATNISEYNSTLNGTVNSNNSYTYYWFEYGVNSALNLSTNRIAFGNSNGNVSQSIGNLSPNTTYSYKLCATNGYGTNCDGILSFTTLTSQVCTYNCGCTSNCGCTNNCGCTSNCGCTNNCGGNAPTVNTSSAGNVADTTATLYGYVNPNGNYSTSVWFKYGQNGNLNYTSYPNPSSVSAQQTVASPISGLQTNTVYAYQICASNQYGQNCGNVLSFVTTNTNAYVNVQPNYYQPQYNYPQEQQTIVIYNNTNTVSGNDYVVGASSLANLKINASKRDVVRGDLVSYTITLENVSNRTIKNVEMHLNAPIDLALTSTSLGEINFATNSVNIKFSSLAVGDSKSFTVTARVADRTSANSFVVHADASYLNTKTGERETVTAEILTGVARNGLLAGAFGAGVGGAGIIWLLIIILIILLAVLIFSQDRKREEVKAVPLPPSRWPTNS